MRAGLGPRDGRGLRDRLGSRDGPGSRDGLGHGRAGRWAVRVGASSADATAIADFGKRPCIR